jgi:hypothetical protein
VAYRRAVRDRSRADGRGVPRTRRGNVAVDQRSGSSTHRHTGSLAGLERPCASSPGCLGVGSTDGAARCSSLGLKAMRYAARTSPIAAGPASVGGRGRRAGVPRALGGPSSLQSNA